MTNLLHRSYATINNYFRLSAKQKLQFVPLATDSIKTPKDFLTKIGRQCDTFADKFQSWEHLFTTSSRDLEEMGIKPSMRKYLLKSREWFSRGNPVKAVEVPSRRNKHLKRKEQVKLLRLKKLGLA
jgi:hypothetical protein